jgi:hypothetical protein
LFDELTAELARGGPDAALGRLAERLKEQKKYHELFDTRLMQARHRLGLPVVLGSGLDDLPEPQRTDVEAAYLEACRETGGLLLEEGRLREGWMYLRPVGDKAAMAAALARIEPSDENREEVIEVALHEGLLPRKGFELVLGHYGTCNAITMFDSTMHRQPREAREEVAALLVRHLHKELTRNLQAEIARQEGQPATETTIAGLVADRDWLFLTEYGRRLGRQYQYAGEEPFVDAHPAHALFFRAQLGEAVEEALDYFRGRAEAAEPAQQGAGAAEVYVALLSRLGRHGEALEASAALIPPTAHVSGFAPTLSELARRAGDFGRHREICQARGDVLGFAGALVEESLAARE